MNKQFPLTIANIGYLRENASLRRKISKIVNKIRVFVNNFDPKQLFSADFRRFAGFKGPFLY